MKLQDVAIVGIGVTKQEKRSERTSAQVMLDAAKLALADAGLHHTDVDGIAARWPGPGGTTLAPGSANPDAVMAGRGPYTAADVLAAPKIVDPFTLLDLCLASEGGAAFVVTSLERARDLRRTPVVILGAGMEWERQQYVDAPRYDELWTIGAQAAEKAFGQAALGPADVDVAQLYDVNSLEVARQFEALGFCAVGEGTDFAIAAGIGLDGKLPTCTDGGLLSFAHIGWGGPSLKIAEAVRQIRGEAGDRQVPGVEVAIAAGAGSGAQYYNLAILGRAR